MTESAEIVDTEVAATQPVEATAPVVTGDTVKQKIKQMIVGIMNTGIRSGIYTTNMVSSAHTFDQLNFTSYEKRRLVLQCDEFFKINLSAAAEGTLRVGDLIDMVVSELQLKDKEPAQAAQEITTEE